MSVHDVHSTISSPPIPGPRTPPSALEVEPGWTPPQDLPTAPDPWRSAGGARPLTEYWDVETASWRSRGPLPDSGD
jgi:hypothetical protein